tara:strand:- start:34 stop:345 length:312 start_codon:yes stop_codon:yes gene_type:complete
MATRSTIGFIENGKITATYCHFDGKPGTMVPAIEKYIAREGLDAFKDLICKAGAEGGLRSIQCQTRLGHDPIVITSREDCFEWGQEYAYLLNVSNGLIEIGNA